MVNILIRCIKTEEDKTGKINRVFKDLINVHNVETLYNEEILLLGSSLKNYGKKINERLIEYSAETQNYCTNNNTKSKPYVYSYDKNAIVIGTKVFSEVDNVQKYLREGFAGQSEKPQKVEQYICNNSVFAQKFDVNKILAKIDKIITDDFNVNIEKNYANNDPNYPKLTLDLNLQKSQEKIAPHLDF